MDGSRNSLYYIQHCAYRVFNKETKQNRYSSKILLDKAFPAVPYSENKFVNVKGNKSPYDGDITYWSSRESKFYNGETSKALKRQNHTCAYCGHKFMPGGKIQLHHKDGNHSNWRKDNLKAMHESCHDHLHMGKAQA
jgi:5-methylcytosine-specific restriction endonuclease McrA